MKTPNRFEQTKTEINFNINEISHTTLKITRVPLGKDSDNKNPDKSTRERVFEKKIICKSSKCCNSIIQLT